MVVIIEENNHIFLARSDALVYLAEPVLKKTLFGAIHVVRTYLMTHFSTPVPLRTCTHCTHFG